MNEALPVLLKRYRYVRIRLLSFPNTMNPPRPREIGIGSKNRFASTTGHACMDRIENAFAFATRGAQEVLATSPLKFIPFPDPEDVSGCLLPPHSPPPSSSRSP